MVVRFCFSVVFSECNDDINLVVFSLPRNSIHRATHQQGGSDWGDPHGLALWLWCSELSIYLYVLLSQVNFLSSKEIQSSFKIHLSVCLSPSLSSCLSVCLYIMYHVILILILVVLFFCFQDRFLHNCPYLLYLNNIGSRFKYIVVLHHHQFAVFAIVQLVEKNKRIARIGKRLSQKSQE